MNKQIEKQQDINNNINPKIVLIGKKGNELWYPKYAPHIIFGTNKSILNEIYIKHLKLNYC